MRKIRNYFYKHANDLGNQFRMSSTNIYFEGVSNVLIVCLSENVRKVAKIMVFILGNLGWGVVAPTFICLFIVRRQILFYWTTVSNSY